MTYAQILEEAQTKLAQVEAGNITEQVLRNMLDKMPDNQNLFDCFYSVVDGQKPVEQVLPQIQDAIEQYKCGLRTIIENCNKLLAK